MSPLILVGLLVGGLVAGLLAFAPLVSASLVRSRARRLPPALSPRMEEEWLAELDAMLGRPSQLAFAIAITLTRRHSFAIDEDSLSATSARPSGMVAAIGVWPSLVILSTLAFAAIAYGASFLIQPMYRSTARLLVVPSRVPEAFVESPVRPPLHDQLQRISERVLSHTTLERMILEAPVYPVDPPAGAAAAVSAGVIERMRRDIDLHLLPDGQSFEVSYLARDPHVAQKGAARIASLCIQVSARDRAVRIESSHEFLEAQVDDVRSRLLNHSARIRSAVEVHAAGVEVERLQHEQLKFFYRGLLMKRERSLLAFNLERRQFGEQFVLIDSPRAAETPISPNRPLIAGQGAGAGLLLGVAMMLAGRNGSFRRLKEVRARP